MVVFCATFTLCAVPSVSEPLPVHCTLLFTARSPVAPFAPLASTSTLVSLPRLRASVLAGRIVDGEGRRAELPVGRLHRRARDIECAAARFYRAAGAVHVGGGDRAVRMRRAALIGDQPHMAASRRRAGGAIAALLPASA